MKKLIFVILVISLSLISYSQEISDLGVDGYYYDIKSDNNGTIHILWLDNGWAKYGQIENRQVVNQIIIPGLARNEVNYEKIRPRISVKPDGTQIHFTWVAPLSATNQQKLMHCWKNSSGTWSKEEIFDSSPDFVTYPAMTVDSEGVLHAVCSVWKYSSSLIPIYYFRKAVGGDWVRQANLTPTNAKYFWSAMFTDSSGNVHMTWDRDKKLLQYRTAPSGGNLADSTTITLPSNWDRNKESDVFVDTLGNVHVAALSYDDPGTTVGIDYWSKPVGGAFSTPVQASPGSFPLLTTNHPNPAVIGNSLDMVAVAWGDRNAPTKVTVSLYNGVGWTPYVMDYNAGFKEETKPSMALNSTTAYLVWCAGDGSITLATFDFAMFGVLSPNGGEEWGFAKTYEIRWNLENGTGNVDINLFKNSVNLGPVVSDIADSGSYSWTIDTLESGSEIVTGDDYQIEVAARDGSDSAMSNSNFSILPSIDITAPAAGITWNMGTTNEITWTKTGTQSDYVNITLFKAGSAVLNITTSADNSGSYFWDIPGTITPGVDYTIRVDTADGVVTDESEIFSILGSITVTSPSAGVEWLYGTTHTITWDVVGTMNSSVKIRLQQNGVNIEAITDSTPNDGSYTWTVPATVPSATNYTMMVKTIDSVVYDSSDLFTISAESLTPTITVTSPVSGSNWNSGSNQTITWDKTGTQDANVKIELFKGGSLDSTISPSTTNDGSYSWTIGGSQPSGSDYMVRITTLDSALTDDSDNFTITFTSPEITVTSPASGVTWNRGAAYTVSWNTAGTMDSNVKIELIKGGTLNATIVTSTANDGSFSWTIDGGQAIGTDYVVRITTLDGEVTDDSGQFSISDAPVFGITVTNPTGSSQWIHGNSYTITWDKTGTMNASVKIRLQQNGVNIVTITNSTPNDGSYRWTVPATVPSASNYTIMVKTIDSLVFDSSDQFYVGSTIVTPTLTVTSPVSSSNWNSGTTQTISWNRTGTQDANVKIELFKGGSLDSTISSSTSNDGNFSWAIDSNQATGSDYVVKITTLDNALTDDSDVFTITLEVVTPTLTVTSPTSSSNWQVGSTQNITWNKAGTQDANVKIELFKGGSFDSNIISSTSNDGSYSWAISGSQAAGSDYVVKITTIDNALTDDSDQFTISEEPVFGITVTNPTGSSQWIYGNTYTITWNKAGTMNSFVKIRLQQNGANILAITDMTANDGSYSWTVPATVPSASNYVIMVKTIDSVVYDVSDQFYIGAEVLTPTITVTNPISSSYWITGSTYAVTWDKTGTQDANVKIDLYKGGTFDSSIISSTPNSGSYSWTINGAQTPGTDYVVRITTVDDQVTDDSGQFTISDTPLDGEIEVASPGSSSELNAGSSSNITWNITGSMDPNVNIYLYNNGSFHSNIALNTPNDGSYSWSLSSGLSSSDRYMVRVETVDAQVTDDSYLFKIFGTGITVNKPEAGDTLVKGSNVNITWKKVGSQNSYVKIRLQRNGTNIVTITERTANDGSFAWTVPTTLTNSDDYYFMVKTVDDLIYDVSDRIRIAAAGILVASPSTNNVLKRGSQYTISWTKTGAQNANVKLRVFQGAVQILNITDSTPNDGSYTWTVPADMTMGNDLVIRVKAIDNLVSDDSGLLTIED